MERQSSRIYFQGKYHKDIYFQGHYHKAMYLTDSNGNATLVWEKLKDTVAGSVSMLSYVNGKYYAVVENFRYSGAEDMANYSRPMLYEGRSLDAMRKRYIWGEHEVRGGYYIMHAAPEKLVIIRTPYSFGPGERYIAVVPVGDGRVDIAGISYQTGTDGYYNTNFNNYIYGGGDNYYRAVSNIWDPAIEKNGTRIRYGERIGGIARIIPCGSRIVGLPGNAVTDGLDAFLPFFTLNEDAGQLELHSVSLSGCVGYTVGRAEKEVTEGPGWTDGWGQIKSRSVTVDKMGANGKYAGFVMTGSCEGYVTLNITASIGYSTGGSSGTHTHTEKFKIKVDFTSLQMTECRNIDSYTVYEVCSQIFADGYRVQTVLRGAGEDPCITYGRTGQDYEDDRQISVYLADSIENRELTSLACHGNMLTVGMTQDGMGKFVVINTDDDTAEYREINIREE